jgi:hypothetical protein
MVRLLASSVYGYPPPTVGRVIIFCGGVYMWCTSFVLLVVV